MDMGKPQPGQSGETPYPYTAVPTAQLPKPNGKIQRFFVNDANLSHVGANVGSPVVGGGANTVPVYSDGTTWRIG